MKKKKKRNIPPTILGIAFLLAMVFAGGLVGASSVTINLPASDALTNGSAFYINYTVNMTSGEVAQIGNLVNLTILLGSTQVGGNNTNFTEGLTTVRQRMDTTLVSDNTAAVLTVRVMNMSNNVTHAQNTVTIRVSNSAPNTPVITGLPSQTVVRSTIDYTVLATSNGGATITYSTTLTDPNSGTATKTGTNPIFSGDEISVMGEYTVVTTATDSLSRTSTKTDTFTANSNSAGIGAVQVTIAEQQVQATQKSKDTGIIIIVALAIIVIYLAVKNKKKGK